MLELLNQLDGFSSTDNVRVIAATNRADILDPALMRSGRLDRKIEFPHPTEDARAKVGGIKTRKGEEVMLEGRGGSGGQRAVVGALHSAAGGGCCGNERKGLWVHVDARRCVCGRAYLSAAARSLQATARSVLR